ncbi:MAG: YjcZ family sporulation protein [Bacilli bacterium]|nr:YjcZ family sporulation protein [Bacillales bacterium]
MYYYGPNYAYPQGGYAAYPYSGNNSSWGGVFAIILVLFILLVIIGVGFNRNYNQNTCCGGF